MAELSTGQHGAATCVALLVTLDTKAEIARFLSYEIIAAGCRPYVIDVGLRGAEEAGLADATRVDVARAAGRTLAGWSALDKSSAMDIVAAGAGRLLHDLFADGTISGVIGIGGGSGQLADNPCGAGTSARLPQAPGLHRHPADRP